MSYINSYTGHEDFRRMSRHSKIVSKRISTKEDSVCSALNKKKANVVDIGTITVARLCAM